MALAAQIRRFGGIPILLGIAKDNVRSLKAKLTRASKYDLIISTGGVSGGDKDLVKSVIAEMGEIYFDKIEMQPGKSTAFGILNSIQYIALAGNPPASMIGCHIFARPAILKMQGRKQCLQSKQQAILIDKLKNSGNIQRYVWVELGKRGSVLYASDPRLNTEGALVSIAHSNALAILPAGCDHFEKGKDVSVIPLDWF
jgi:molybdopterin molybdotransferase